MVGTGYVGLVAAACFAEFGHQVTAIDRDERKIEKLLQGIMPIYEPGLEELVNSHHARKNLHFSTTVSSAAHADVVVLAVGTPPLPDGSSDLRMLYGAAEEIAPYLQKHAVIVIKSTVPVGTARGVYDHVASRVTHGSPIAIVSNPEFLRQGFAVYDFLNPDRVVIGGATLSAEKVMKSLYAPLIARQIPYLEANNETAEIIKYAANSMLAVRISFVNELALLCDLTGADIAQVTKGIGIDPRIGPAFLQAGPGYGGSCLPKDVKSLSAAARSTGMEFLMAQACDEVNHRQHSFVVARLRQILGSLKGQRIALWGLAFKPKTDDTRESPAMAVAAELIEAGAEVIAHDPLAAELAKRELPELIISDDPMSACDQAAALVLMTEWDIYKQADFQHVYSRLARPVLFDTRNALNGAALRELGLEYYCIGRMAASGGSIAETKEAVVALIAEHHARHDSEKLAALTSQKNTPAQAHQSRVS